MDNQIEEMAKKRIYIKKAFKAYMKNKKELLTLPIPGQNGVDYSRVVVSSGRNKNGVEKQVVSYVDKKRALEKQVELVQLTIEHFQVEYLAKGKRQYLYVIARFVKQLGYHASAIECEIPERTSDYWLEEIYTVAEALGEARKLF